MNQRIYLVVLLAIGLWSANAQLTPTLTGLYDPALDCFVLSINVPGSIEASTDLATWVILSEQPGAEFSDPESATLPWRYYRLSGSQASGTVVVYMKIDLDHRFSFVKDPFISAELTWPDYLYRALGTNRDRDLNGTHLFLWNASTQRFQHHLQDFAEFVPTPPPRTPDAFCLYLVFPRTIIFSGELPRAQIQHDYPAGLFLLGAGLAPASPGELVPNVPEGSMIYVWSEQTQQYQTSIMTLANGQLL